MTSWQDSYRDSIRSLSQLKSFFKNSPEHFQAIPEHFDDKLYPILIPKAFLERIKQFPVNSPLWLQFIPSVDELSMQLNKQGLTDPIGDQIHQKTKQLIHRYTNRVLFIPTTICPVNCRYCFRKNELYTADKIFENDFDKSLKYLKAHPEINEVIFTGGDPLIISDQKLFEYFSKFSEIPSIKFIRLHSRTPVILPERLSPKLLSIFSTFSERFQFSLAIHINHIDEFSTELDQNLKEFKLHLNILSQTVLLKGVNDSIQTLADLFKRLSFSSIIPYYLHHPDQVKGAMNFVLSIEEGREIYKNLSDIISGWMRPEYIVDLPGGHGKAMAYNSESLEFGGSLIDKDGISRSLVSKRTPL